MNDKRFEAWWASNPARAALDTTAKEVARGIWRAAQRDLAAELLEINPAPAGASFDALIHGVQTVKKPADGGWVEWNGGNRPVAAHCEVKIVCREGSTSVACAYRYDWTHRGYNTDIVRYRVCA